MTELAGRIARVRERIAAAAVKSGRAPEAVRLIGATKTMPVETVKAAMPYLDGAGENRVKELVEKQAAGAYLSKEIHFIGHLQRNKVRHVAGKVHLLQSVDSLRLALAVSDEMQKLGGIQDVLVEINIGKEEAKSGFMPETAFDAVSEIAALPGIRVNGLMSVPPIAASESARRRVFSALYQLFIDIKAKKYDNRDMAYLSMGMSADYYEAILEGANIVRVGTAIFGDRNYGCE